MTRSLHALFLLPFLVLSGWPLGGCDGPADEVASTGSPFERNTGPSTATEGSATAKAEKPTGARRQGATPGKAAGTGFEIETKTAGPYHVDQTGAFELLISPTNGYHINLEYPAALTVRAPAQVSVPQTTLKRSDAAEFDEKAARFYVSLTPKANGTHDVVVDVSFAVCTEKVCVPQKREVTVGLLVE